MVDAPTSRLSSAPESGSVKKRRPDGRLEFPKMVWIDAECHFDVFERLSVNVEAGKSFSVMRWHGTEDFGHDDDGLIL